MRSPFRPLAPAVAAVVLLWTLTVPAAAQPVASRVAVVGVPNSTLPGLAAGDAYGSDVAPAGDVNGDGHADLLVGAPANDAAGADAGRAYVYFGGPAADAVPDVTFTGEAAGDTFGENVAGAGDVNGDGYDDVIVGAQRNDAVASIAGRAYVYFGGTSPNATADLVLSGETLGSYFGVDVAGAGDVNRDGFDDVVVGAYGHSSSRGRAYVFYGGAAPNAVADLTVSGTVSGDLLGSAVAGAGDVNGDGYDDWAVASPNDDAAGVDAGRVLVFFGGTVPNAVADLVLAGAAGDGLGVAVAGAGDVNGDGYDDWVAGATASAGALAGRAALYFGGAAPDAVPDLAVVGALGENLGDAVAGAGDVNGDGYDDWVVGTPNNDAAGNDAGRAAVYFGGAVPNATADLTVSGDGASDYLGRAIAGAGDLDGDGLDDLAFGVPDDDIAVGTDAGSVLLVSNANAGAGVAEWRALGAGVVQQFGWAVADAGDVNGDGYGDTVVGAPIAAAGRAALYFGGPGADAVADLTLIGTTLNDQFGIAVAGVGDLNGDGYDDWAVGAPGSDAGALDGGQATVYFGGAIPNATADLTITGAVIGNRLGDALAAAGDVNGDGYGDLALGVRLDDVGGLQSGRVDVYYGGAAPDALPDLVVTGTGGEQLGFPVDGAGDVNGDGFADVLAGAAQSAAGGVGAGRAYVFFGGAAPDTAADLTISGTVSNGNLGEAVAGAGDVNGDGYDDVLVGTPDGPAGGIEPGRAALYLGGPVPNAVADVTMIGAVASGELGRAVAGAGDVNGDGYADWAVGSPANGLFPVGPGSVGVYFGGPVLDATPDLTLAGEVLGDQFGYSVALGPDANGDGRADVLVGANLNDAAGTTAGAAYLFRATGPAAAPGLYRLADIAADQGGALDLRWTRSDGEARGTVTGYRVERSLPAGQAGYAWETLAVVSATDNARYSLAAATYTDQTAGNPATACFRVTATGPGAAWRSLVRCGASIDNLAPPAPPALAVTGSPDGDALVRVTVLAAPPADLASYAVTRSVDAVCDAGDVPVGSALATGAATVTVEDDATDFGTDVWYCASAVDAHGNASALAGAATANPAVLAAVRVALQGAYQAGLPGGALMRSGIENLLPTTQPYAGPPWNYAGTESLTPALLASHAVVDWVLVEVRTAPTVPSGVYAAALLLADGTLLDPATATAGARVRPAAAGGYHVAVFHRTHLAAMTALSVTLSDVAANPVYDLTASPAFVYGGPGAVRQVAPDVFALWGGDGDGSGSVLATDRQTVWLPAVGGAGYLAADFTLDGSVLADDRQLVLDPNVGRQSAVPGAVHRPAAAVAADTR